MKPSTYNSRVGPGDGLTSMSDLASEMDESANNAGLYVGKEGASVSWIGGPREDAMSSIRFR